MSEAKRIAATIRLLVHDKGSSTSLLEHLGIKHRLEYFDSRLGDVVSGRESDMSFIAVVLGPDGMRYGNTLDAPIGWPTFDFDHWWTTAVMQTRQHTYSRSELVLKITNQDGGVHVDADLFEPYRQLSRENPWRTRSVGGPTRSMGSPVPGPERGNTRVRERSGGQPPGRCCCLTTSGNPRRSYRTGRAPSVQAARSARAAWYAPKWPTKFA